MEDFLSYLDRNMAISAIKKMKNFHESLMTVHDLHGIDFFADLGRRNILMSRPQETFFCEAIKTKFPQTVSDGRTGQPDIVIPSIGRELECKITTKRKGGSWSFQADYATLEKKGSCDFLYVCCDEKFENFGVFFFDNLTVEDFKPPAPGSRGKSRLLLKNCRDKCYPLVGDMTDRNSLFIKKAKNRLSSKESSEYEKMKARSSLEYWENNPKSYTIHLEQV